MEGGGVGGVGGSGRSGEPRGREGGGRAVTRVSVRLALFEFQKRAEKFVGVWFDLLISIASKDTSKVHSSVVISLVIYTLTLIGKAKAKREVDL